MEDDSIAEPFASFLQHIVLDVVNSLHIVYKSTKCFALHSGPGRSVLSPILCVSMAQSHAAQHNETI